MRLEVDSSLERDPLGFVNRAASAAWWNGLWSGMAIAILLILTGSKIDWKKLSEEPPASDAGTPFNRPVDWSGRKQAEGTGPIGNPPTGPIGNPPPNKPINVPPNKVVLVPPVSFIYDEKTQKAVEVKDDNKPTERTPPPPAGFAPPK